MSQVGKGGQAEAGGRVGQSGKGEGLMVRAASSAVGRQGEGAGKGEGKGLRVVVACSAERIFFWQIRICCLVCCCSAL